MDSHKPVLEKERKKTEFGKNFVFIVLIFSKILKNDLRKKILDLQRDFFLMMKALSKNLIHGFVYVMGSTCQSLDIYMWKRGDLPHMVQKEKGQPDLSPLST